VQQQQGGLPGTLSFTSQYGTFTVESLPLMGPAGTKPGPAANPAPTTVGAGERTAAVPPPPAAPSEQAAPASTDADAVLVVLERLSDLHQRGVLTDEEFATKKAELLSRL
jgi:hypothetical protein